MMRQFGFLIGVLILQTWFVSTGYSADTDKKIISASACQVTDPEDRGKLAYRVRGIVAQADIQITCPITRDSTGKDNPLNWLDARYQRGWSIPPQGSDKDQFMAAIAYWVLQQTIIACEGPTSVLKSAVGGDWKGKLSPWIYLFGIVSTFWVQWLAQALYILMALVWLVPDRRIEHALQQRQT